MSLEFFCDVSTSCDCFKCDDLYLPFAEMTHTTKACLFVTGDCQLFVRANFLETHAKFARQLHSHLNIEFWKYTAMAQHRCGENVFTTFLDAQFLANYIWIEPQCFSELHSIFHCAAYVAFAGIFICCLSVLFIAAMNYRLSTQSNGWRERVKMEECFNFNMKWDFFKEKWYTNRVIFIRKLWFCIDRFKKCFKWYDHRFCFVALQALARNCTIVLFCLKV